VFLSPLFDLGNQIHRDVSGVGFALDLPVSSGPGALASAQRQLDCRKRGGWSRGWRPRPALSLEVLLAAKRERRIRVDLGIFIR